MPICNRDLDVSQQKVVLNLVSNAVVGTGATVIVGVVPYPAKIKKAEIAGFGLSGAPVYNVNVHRWTTAGLTVFDPLGVAVTLAGAYGLSGAASAFSVTSSPINLAYGDLLIIKSSGANTAVSGLVAGVAIQKLQDIVSDFGSST